MHDAWLSNAQLTERNAEQQRRRRIRRPRPHSLTNEANEYELDVWLVLPSLIGSYIVSLISS